MRNIRRNTFVKPPTGQSEWLLDAQESLTLVLQLFEHMNIGRSASILVPGVGMSDLPRKLFDLGFKNLTLCDVERDALAHQKASFHDVTAPHIVVADLTDPSSLDGLFICFSIFHRKWKTCKLLPAAVWHVSYTSISKFRHSRTRPTIVRKMEHVAFFVAVKKENVNDEREQQLITLQEVCTHLFCDLAQKRLSRFPECEASLD